MGQGLAVEVFSDGGITAKPGEAGLQEHDPRGLIGQYAITLRPSEGRLIRFAAADHIGTLGVIEQGFECFGLEALGGCVRLGQTEPRPVAHRLGRSADSQRRRAPGEKGQLELAYFRCWSPRPVTFPSSSPSPSRGGRWRTASPRPRTRPAWTTTRSVATAPGTGTSPCPCSATRSSPSPPARRQGRPGRSGARRWVHGKKGT